MSNIKDTLSIKWKFAQDWFESRNQRERIMVSVLLAATMVTIWLLLINDPLAEKLSRAQTGLQNLHTQIKASSMQQSMLIKQQHVDPNQDIKQRIKNIDTRIAQLDTELTSRMEGLIEPTQMANILEQVLFQSSDMRLISIRSLAAEPLVIASEEQEPTDPNNLQDSAEQKTEFAVYRHGVQLELQGNYLSTLAYLKKLQALPWSLFWDEVSLDVTRYPNAHIVITVHTVSLKEGWLGV